MGFSSYLQTAMLPLLTAPLLPCDTIVCPTQSSRAAVERRLTAVAEKFASVWNSPLSSLPRLALIPWGIDTERFAPLDQASARRTLDLPLDRPILLCGGRVRIQDKMDWTVLLLMFDRICRMVQPRPLLILAGSNPSEYGRLLLSQASDLGLGNDVESFFDLPDACLPSLYAACDIFLSPVDTLSETFGLTIAEAMACGRPVVGSDWDGYKELIVHGITGFKVRTDWVDCLGEVNALAPVLGETQVHLHAGQSVNVDVGQLAHYVVELLKNHCLRAKMGQLGRKHAVARYDWRAVISQWETLWRETMAIARTLDPAPYEPMAYLQPHYSECLSHYATRIVTDALTVQLTPRGHRILAKTESLQLHPTAEEYLKREAMHVLLHAIKTAGWLASTVRIGPLLRLLQQSLGLTHDQALRHLMWVAKYDLVSFSESES
jgi:glycosyltransferase involved in cell wall biosynthesis